METAWVLDTLAVTVCDIDFVDPAVADQPDARERGVRVELRPVETSYDGSVYASPTRVLRPAVCRIDLLESAPGAADRMHWHPVMDDGEPGERTFEVAMAADPPGWLRARLAEPAALLTRAGVTPEPHAGDLEELAALAAEVVARVEQGLRRARRPWPQVRHDERGLAPVS
jgi:hypothetical protein